MWERWLMVSGWKRVMVRWLMVWGRGSDSSWSGGGGAGEVAHGLGRRSGGS